MYRKILRYETDTMTEVSISALICLEAVVTGAVKNLLHFIASTEKLFNAKVTYGEFTIDHSLTGKETKLKFQHNTMDVLLHKLQIV